MNIVAKKAFASRRCKKRARLAIPCWRRAVAAPLEQAPKKLIDLFDKRLLQHFDFERFLIVRTIPFERKALAVDRIEAPDWRRGASATARTARADSPPSPPPTAFHAEGRGLAKTGRVGSKNCLARHHAIHRAGRRLRTSTAAARKGPRRAEAEQGAGQRFGPWIGQEAWERVNSSDSCRLSCGPAALTPLHHKERKGLASRYIRSNY